METRRSKDRKHYWRQRQQGWKTGLEAMRSTGRKEKWKQGEVRIEYKTGVKEKQG